MAIDTALIARLEAATEGNEDLDEAVAVAAGWEQRWHEMGPTLWHEPGMAECLEQSLPAFTTSLDVAMTLKPSGANCWGLEHTPRGVSFYWSRNNVPEGHWLSEGHHKSSDALAACIAALGAGS